IQFTGSLCTTTCHGTSSSSSPRVSFSLMGASTVEVDPFSSCPAFTALIKKCYHTAPSLQTTRVGKNSQLNDCHLPRVRLISIVEPVQVEQTVDDVQAQLARESVSESLGIAARSLGADKDFAVLKCDHVGRSRFIHELSMQRCHLAIRDD